MRKLAAMFRWTLPACLLICASAHAVPLSTAEEDVQRLLADKGLIGRLGDQVEQVRHSVGEKASELVVHAMGFLGVPYKRGGSSAETGFDCSGFIGYLFKEEAGMQLPRSTREMINVNAPLVARNNLKPGDLLFFSTNGRGRVSHAGIYLGDDQFIHSSSRRSGGVRIDSLGDTYWNKTFIEAKRALAMAPTSVVARK